MNLNSFRLMYETDSFFETIAEKNYGEVNNFLVSPWSDDFEASSRSMHYEFQQAFAFSKVCTYSITSFSDICLH